MNELKEQCSRHCSELKNLSTQSGFQLTEGIKPMEVSGVVAAVDSGFSSRQFLSLDVMLLRSMSCIFTYEKNNLVESVYFPNRVPGISVHYGVFSDPTDSSCFKSLSRLSAELNCAVQTVKVFKPKLILIDGSLLPLPSDKPSQGSSLSPIFEEVISLYSQLYSACVESNCLLVGIVKDSRSQKLCNLLEKKLATRIPVNNDEFLCNLLLKPNEKSLVFPLDTSHENIHCFYMKTGDGLPMRVEFLASGDANEVASSVAGQLHSLSPQFSYPSILIEVDMRASLMPREISTLFNSLESNAKELVLRSNSRPFRC